MSKRAVNKSPKNSFPSQSPDGHRGTRRNHRRRTAVAAGPRSSAAAPAAARPCSPSSFSSAALRNSASPASSWPSRRRPRNWPRTSARSASTWTSWPSEKKLLVDYVHVERSEIEETGEYDLEGLFIRLGHAIDSIGAKRVVLDTIETLFGGLSNAAILRSELRRLFRWLKDKGVTAVITGERGDGVTHPPGTGGICLRLRHPARPPRHREPFDPAAANRQVSRDSPRHQRVSRS